MPLSDSPPPDWFQLTWGDVWKRLQWWEGSRAPIDVTSLEYRLIGVRHETCNDAHRSFDNHVACLHKESLRHMREHLEQWAAHDSSIDVERKLSKAQSAASESLARVRSLRFF